MLYTFISPEQQYLFSAKGPRVSGLALEQLFEQCRSVSKGASDAKRKAASHILGDYSGRFPGEPEKSIAKRSIINQGPVCFPLFSMQSLLGSRFFAREKFFSILSPVFQRAKQHPLLQAIMMYGALSSKWNPLFKCIVMPERYMGDNVLGTYNRLNTIELKAKDGSFDAETLLHEIMHYIFADLFEHGTHKFPHEKLKKAYQETLNSICPTIDTTYLNGSTKKIARTVNSVSSQEFTVPKIRWDLLAIGTDAYESLDSDKRVASELICRIVNITYKYPNDTEVQKHLKPLYDFIDQEVLPHMLKKISSEPRLWPPYMDAIIIFVLRMRVIIFSAISTFVFRRFLEYHILYYVLAYLASCVVMVNTTNKLLSHFNIKIED